MCLFSESCDNYDEQLLIFVGRVRKLLWLLPRDSKV